jgi:ribosomal protein L35
MPKLKIRSKGSAKKRFRVTGTGKLSSQSRGFAHLLENKNRGETKRKMRLKDVDKTMIRMMKCLLPVGVKGRKIRNEKKED